MLNKFTKSDRTMTIDKINYFNTIFKYIDLIHFQKL